MSLSSKITADARQKLCDEIGCTMEVDDFVLFSCAWVRIRRLEDEKAQLKTTLKVLNERDGILT